METAGEDGVRSRKQSFPLPQIRTKKEPDGDEDVVGAPSSMVEEDEQPLSPAARLFHSPNINCYIIAVMGCKTKFDAEVIKVGLEMTLVKHPRFSSLMVVEGERSKKMKWVRTKVNVEDHIIIPDLNPNIDSPDQFLEDYLWEITKTPLELSKPLWEFHILNLKTSDAEAVGIFRVHHSMGDGSSLVSLLLACTRKASDPTSLPTVPNKKRAVSETGAGFWSVFLAIWSVIRLIWNTAVDMLLYGATVMILKDSETPIKGTPTQELNTRRFVHRTVSLEDVKLVKNAMNATINDVVLGVTQAGLSQYLDRRYGEKSNEKRPKERKSHVPKNLRVRSTVLVNLRPSAGIQALADMMEKESKTRWGNWIGYIILPFTIGLRDNPVDYIREAKAAIDRKKQSLEAVCAYYLAQLFVRVFGVKISACLTHRILSNATLSFSNVVGPVEEISFFGHKMAYLAPSVYGHPQALTVHYQSYMDKITISVAVDPKAIPDPYRLLDDLEHSLKLIKEAVLKMEKVANGSL
ncbi:O-acyltransferase, WSD1-like, N-terminal [Dillenia turbinata]|uniref:O-acyltransferase, WSD1-like, N-terminal n=1 Tax=Dillenia turbinata TaxID=194707 RepID=A0AAN8VEF5_9MAGN